MELFLSDILFLANYYGIDERMLVIKFLSNNYPYNTVVIPEEEASISVKYLETLVPEVKGVTTIYVDNFYTTKGKLIKVAGDYHNKCLYISFIDTDTKRPEPTKPEPTIRSY